MKNIKLFFVRNYQRFIRFLISFSVISVFIFGVFSVSAASAPIVYTASISQPQLTGNDCYLEVVTANGWKMVVYVSLAPSPSSNNVSSAAFHAFVEDNKLFVSTLSALPSDRQLYGYMYDATYGGVSSLHHVETGNPADSLYVGLGNSGAITGIHGYNCYVDGISTSNNQFVFSYGVDTSFNNFLSAINSSVNSGVGKLDTISSTLVTLYNQNKAFFGSVNMQQILKAIQDNKSSAEKNEYSGATDEQKKAQSDLDTSEKKISEDTADARASTINIFKNFTLPGDIMKGLLCVTNIFNSLCAGVPFAPIILNFSLAIGAAAFLLGLTAVFVRFGRSRK